MPTITKVEAQKNNKSRANIFVDGKYLFSLDIEYVISNSINNGLELTDSEINNLINESHYEKVLSKILNFISYRPRSKKEVSDRLKEYQYKSGFSQDLVNKIVSHLEEKGLINDPEFASWFVNQRMTHRPRSLIKLKGELYAKGVSDQDISFALSSTGYNEIDVVKKIISKSKSSQIDKERLITKIKLQGYRYSNILQALKDIES